MCVIYVTFCAVWPEVHVHFLGPGSHKADENDNEARHGREDFGVLQQRSTAVQRIESTLEVV